MDMSVGVNSYAQQSREYQLSQLPETVAILLQQDILTSQAVISQAPIHESIPSAVVNISDIARKTMIEDAESIDNRVEAANQRDLEQKEQNQENLQQFVSSAQKLSQLDVVQIRLENRVAIESYKLIERKVVGISGVNELEA